MKITILTSSKDHPVYSKLEAWACQYSKDHDVDLVLSPQNAIGGDMMFLISCSDIVDEDVRKRYKDTLIVHASDLPHGRGWSPHIWAILEGADEITVSLLEAENKVDTGRIWLQDKIKLEGHELYDEINELLFASTLKLMSAAIDDHQNIHPSEQSENGVSYYPKRSPHDSSLDITAPIIDQFDLLRVVDPNRFPAFFEHKGHRYVLRIEKDHE